MRKIMPVRVLLLLGLALGSFPLRAAETAERSATPAESLRVLPGFKVQLLRSAEKSEGSWICMTFDGKGRLIPITGF
jgi:hypothetical protein